MKIKKMLLIGLTLTSINAYATENNESYKMGEIIGNQLNKKINTLNNLGEEIDINNFIKGLNKTLVSETTLTKKEVNSLIKKIKKPSSTSETDISYSIISKSNSGVYPAKNDTIKIKYRVALPDGEFSKNKETTFNISSIMSKRSEILKRMEIGSIYELQIPHFLNNAKNNILNEALISWFNEEKHIINKDSIFNQPVPHQIYVTKETSQQLKPYSDMTLQIEMIDII